MTLHLTLHMTLHLTLHLILREMMIKLIVVAAEKAAEKATAAKAEKVFPMLTALGVADLASNDDFINVLVDNGLTTVDCFAGV